MLQERMTSPEAVQDAVMTSLMTSRCHVVLDVASLMLRRMNAVPVRLKILLDRLLGTLDGTVDRAVGTLDGDRVRAILHECGWTYDDYLRGYKLQVATCYTASKYIHLMQVGYHCFVIQW